MNKTLMLRRAVISAGMLALSASAAFGQSAHQSPAFLETAYFRHLHGSLRSPQIPAAIHQQFEDAYVSQFGLNSQEKAALEAFASAADAVFQQARGVSQNAASVESQITSLGETFLSSLRAGVAAKIRTAIAGK